MLRAVSRPDESGVVCSVSRFAKGFDAKAVEAFPGGQGFGRQATVQRGFYAQHKFAAELFSGQGFGQLAPVPFQNLNPFLHDAAKRGIHFGFVLAVTTLADERRGAADKATIFIAPLHDFRVARRLHFQFASFHFCDSSILRRTWRSWYGKASSPGCPLIVTRIPFR